MAVLLFPTKVLFVSVVNWDPFRDILDEYKSFLITTHVRPDGDALGSQRGLAAILESLGKQVTMINATAPPANLRFMNSDGRVLRLGEDIRRDAVPPVDVRIVVDTGVWQQLGDMAAVVRDAGGVRVVIDHHVSSDDLNALEFRDQNAAATAELICELSRELDVALPPDAAGWLYVAIATDTGWFRFPSTTASTMRAAAYLMECGACPDELYRRIHEQKSVARVHLAGRALQGLRTDCGERLAWIQVRQDDLKETGAVLADTEGLVNQCLTIAGAETAFIAVELPTQQVKFSLRCRPQHNVAAVAERLGGGGHRLASGVTLDGPLDAAVDTVLREFRVLLDDDADTAAAADSGRDG